MNGGPGQHNAKKKRKISSHDPIIVAVGGGGVDGWGCCIARTATTPAVVDDGHGLERPRLLFLFAGGMGHMVKVDLRMAAPRSYRSGSLNLSARSLQFVFQGRVWQEPGIMWPRRVCVGVTHRV